MNHMKSLFKFDGLKLAQYAFIVIAIGIFIITFGVTTTPSDKVFESPVFNVQLLLVFTYPFCYLCLKSIREKMEEFFEDQKAPLWLFLIMQISSFNLILIFLCGYGIVQNYGKEFFQLSALKITEQNKRMIISMLPLAFLYGLILFVRIRIGMI